MKKNRILWMFAVLMMAFGMSSCSSDDEESSSELCYTGIIKYISPESGNVQVVITYSPDEINSIPDSPIIKGTEVLFVGKELTNSVLQIGDAIDFKVTDWQRISFAGTADKPMLFVCSVKPCKITQ